MHNDDIFWNKEEENIFTSVFVFNKTSFYYECTWDMSYRYLCFVLLYIVYTLSEREFKCVPVEGKSILDSSPILNSGSGFDGRCFLKYFWNNLVLTTVDTLLHAHVMMWTHTVTLQDMNTQLILKATSCYNQEWMKK